MHQGNVCVYAAFCLALSNAFKHKRRQSASALQMKRIKANQIQIQIHSETWRAAKDKSKRSREKGSNPKANKPFGTPAACALAPPFPRELLLQCHLQCHTSTRQVLVHLHLCHTRLLHRQHFLLAETNAHLLINDWSGCCPAPGDPATSRAPPDGDDTLAELLLRLSDDKDTPSLHQNVNFHNDVSVASSKLRPARRANCSQRLRVYCPHLNFLELDNAKRRILA